MRRADPWFRPRGRKDTNGDDEDSGSGSSDSDSSDSDSSDSDSDSSDERLVRASTVEGVTSICHVALSGS